MVDLAQLLVTPETSIREVITCIDRNAKGIALVMDAERRLLGTITDGDIRRAILAGVDLGSMAQTLLKCREPVSHLSPLTAPVGTTDTELLRMMNEYGIHQIPVIDENQHVVDIAFLNDLTKEYELPLTAVIMAGGYGTRLYPLTDKLPKPMLPVGRRPLLELMVEQLRSAGIKRVNVTTHYKGDVIAQHFGDGRDFGVEIRYVQEKEPLGTAGGLSLLEASEEPLLVINGDILTQVDFRVILDFHRKHLADMTVAVRQYEFRVPYGVIDCEGILVKGVSEKPTIRHFINAGIYLLEPTVRRFIPNDKSFDMTDLMQCLIKEGRLVVGFPIREYWLDIGRHEDYEQAQQQVKDWESHS